MHKCVEQKCWLKITIILTNAAFSDTFAASKHRLKDGLGFTYSPSGPSLSSLDPAGSQPHVVLHASLPVVVPSLRDAFQPPHRAHLPVLHLPGQADVYGQRSSPDPVPGTSRRSPTHRKWWRQTPAPVNGGIWSRKLVFEFHEEVFFICTWFFFYVWTWLDPYELHVSSRAECVLPCQAVVTMVTAHLLFLISLISYFMQTQTSFLQLCA